MALALGPCGKCVPTALEREVRASWKGLRTVLVRIQRKSRGMLSETEGKETLVMWWKHFSKTFPCDKV